MRSPRFAPLLFAACVATSGIRAEVLPFDAGVAIGSESGGIDDAASGDFDGDGDDDIAYASRSNSRVSWSRNDRSGYAPRTTLFSREGVTRLVAADFDLDGRVDLVTATSSGVLAWHRGLRPTTAGLAQFETRSAMATGLSGVTRLAAGDINADGRADLIVGRDESAPLHAFVFTGDATDGFAAGVVVPVPNGAGRIAGLGVADFDDNGVADIVATANSAPGPGNPIATLFVVPRTNSSTFGTPLVVESITSSSGFLTLTYGPLAVADLNAFNGPDVVFVQNSSQGIGELIARHNSAGSLGTNAGPFRTRLHSVIDRIDSLQPADLDRDGDLDLAYTAGPGPQGRWLENRREMPFAPHDLGAVADHGDFVATFVTDDDHDGDPDFLTATQDGEVRRLRNRRIHGRNSRNGGDGVLHGVTVRDSASAPLSGPFDIVTRRRGRVDQREVLVTEFIGGRVQAFRVSPTQGGPPLITFDALPVVTEVGAARELSLFDERFDGDEDFIVATGKSVASAAPNQDRLIFSRNEGAGTAASNTLLGCTQGIDLRSVAIGEFPGLGRRVVYAAEGNDRVSLAVCPGETVVSTAANGVPNGPTVSKLGDLDQDGDLDLLVAARLPDAPPLLGDLIGWYPNTGNAVFGALQRIGVVAGADEATLLDFDRDGRLDIATASNGDPSLDPLAGRVLLFRNLGDGAFAPALVAATGVQDPGRVEGADVDHDGDIDLLVPSDSPLVRQNPRPQCGIGLYRQRDDGSFESRACLDGVGLNRPYTRLAVEDMTRDGAVDVFATSFIDNAIAVLALAPPEEYAGLHQSTQSDVVLQDGQETCLYFLDLQSLARPDDSVVALARYTIESSAIDAAGVLEDIVLRLDDGDRAPNPAADTELVRSTAPVDGRWTLDLPAPRGNLVAGAPKSRFWACLRAKASVPATAQEFTLNNPVDTVVDSSTLLSLPGFGSDRSGTFTRPIRVRSARVFRDGIEER